MATMIGGMLMLLAIGSGIYHAFQQFNGRTQERTPLAAAGEAPAPGPAAEAGAAPAAPAASEGADAAAPGADGAEAPPTFSGPGGGGDGA
mmetsp:Transcript_8431/g.15414  ORF Transcript_8431/g.15414 Transcript_8431/m.15414 type:complete len:90 (-) Transcript_8431:65-334(-)